MSAGRKPPRRTSQKVLEETNRDPPKTLKELQDAVAIERDGTDVHHIAEKTAADRDGFPKEWIYARTSEARIPRLKHRKVTAWYQTRQKALQWATPREYLRGRTWEDRYEYGLQVLIKMRVLKP